MEKAIRRGPVFPGFPLPPQRRMSAFSYLVRSITFQQLAGKAAATIHGRLLALSPRATGPSAQEILNLPIEKMRGAGLSAAKTAAIRDLSARFLDGSLKLGGLQRLSDEAVIERLVQVRGIGPWTAQMFLMFKLGRLDVFPIADLGIQEGLRVVDGLKDRPTSSELELRGAVWAPLRSVASWYLWQVADGRIDLEDASLTPRAKDLA